MPLGEVERVEVVAGRLDLAAVDDLVAETEEDVLDLAPHLRDGWSVRAAAARRAEQSAGKRDVDPLGREPFFELGARELLLARGERRLDRLAHRVERHARLAVAHLAQRELQRAAAAEVLDARLVELGERRRGRDRGERLLLQGLRIHGGDCIHGFSSFRGHGQRAGTPRLVLRRRSPLLARRRPGDEPGLRKGEGARGGHRADTTRHVRLRRLGARSTTRGPPT